MERRRRIKEEKGKERKRKKRKQREKKRKKRGKKREERRERGSLKLEKFGFNKKNKFLLEKVVSDH